uniref:Uncharacterized protein n=1 Tax=Meloidogyne enterolobii TaxID=390850 RepID=A0A6V7VVB3_MELEN|nr:unnamed protein product [Meloidogyne enterolobii]
MQAPGHNLLIGEFSLDKSVIDGNKGKKLMLLELLFNFLEVVNVGIVLNENNGTEIKRKSL